MKRSFINTSTVEVTNISKHGFWILIGSEELYLPFKDFPWFQKATVSSILKVELNGEEHLYWPELDIDLTLDSIRYPENYPLISKFDA
ncbi:MAG: DUF2442 domain-containing protein [Candidatus Latescibacter sp.]|nr:DUF2442 domain-containing protein [Candidatus Latescibacter sp.]